MGQSIELPMKLPESLTLDDIRECYVPNRNPDLDVIDLLKRIEVLSEGERNRFTIIVGHQCVFGGEWDEVWVLISAARSSQTFNILGQLQEAYEDFVNEEFLGAL